MKLGKWTLTLLRCFHLLFCACLASCSDAPATEEAAPPLVSVVEIGRETMNAILSVTGTVRLRDEIDLGFTTPGRIETLAVDEGQEVRRDQLVAALDTTNVGADLSAARAESVRARKEWERARELFEDGWVTRPRLDNAEATYRAAQAQVEAAAFAARTARITAPADGVILARHAEPGQVVEAGRPVVTFGSRSSGFVLAVPLTDRQAAAVSVGQAALVYVDALGPAPIPATLTELSGRADPATGTFAAQFAMQQQSGLRSGQIGRAEIVGDVLDEIVIPPAAVYAARAGEAFVWIYDAETRSVSPRLIHPGPLVDSGLSVREGLAPGERIVTSGLAELSAGVRVRIR